MNCVERGTVTIQGKPSRLTGVLTSLSGKVYIIIRMFIILILVCIDVHLRLMLQNHCLFALRSTKCQLFLSWGQTRHVMSLQLHMKGSSSYYDL